MLLGCAGAVLLWVPSLTALAAGMLLPAVATLVVSLRIAARLGWQGVGGSSGRRLPIDAKTAGVEFRREILPIGLGIVLSALYFRIDIFLVELWRGTQAVALYNARVPSDRGAPPVSLPPCSRSRCRFSHGPATGGRSRAYRSRLPFSRPLRVPRCGSLHRS